MDGVKSVGSASQLSSVPITAMSACTRRLSSVSADVDRIICIDLYLTGNVSLNVSSGPPSRERGSDVPSIFSVDSLGQYNLFSNLQDEMCNLHKKLQELF